MRAGFTLLEVLVAAMIAAVLLLSANAVFEQLAASRSSTERDVIRVDHSQNAAEVLRNWVREVDVSPQLNPSGTPHSFSGDSIAARFTSWCIAPGGWERECNVTLSVVRDSNAGSLTGVSSTGDSASIKPHGGVLKIQYLIDASDGGRWARSWPTGPTVPIAIGIVSPSDTMILRVGARG